MVMRGSWLKLFQLLKDPLCDAFGIELVVVHELAGLTGLAELVVDTDTCDLNAVRDVAFGDDLSYCTSESSDNGVLFYSEYSARR